MFIAATCCGEKPRPTDWWSAWHMPNPNGAEFGA